MRRFGRPRMLTNQKQQKVISLIQKEPSESADSLLKDMLQDRTRWLVQKPYKMCSILQVFMANLPYVFLK